MTRTAWLLNLSISKAKEAWKLGKDASYQGYYTDSCPYPALDPSVRDLRECWLKGWRHGESDRRPATE